jgi:hypothetical protein
MNTEQNEKYRLSFEESIREQRQKMILEHSNKTQTQQLVKEKYKDLEQHRLLAKITGVLETNDHEGYCSGDECEYKRKIVKKKILVPEQYKELQVGKIQHVKEYKWANHLPLPDINVYGSDYCRCDYKKSHRLERHCYRYTIQKVEIVENPKYIEVEAEVKAVKKGYVILAGEAYETEGGYAMYGFCKTVEEAHIIAREAVKTGSVRQQIENENKGKDYSIKGRPRCWSHVVDLDTLKVIHKVYIHDI